MRHVADGELHAWLDGALDQLGEARTREVREHLRTCGACREKLVLEEALRARADEVLALSAPAVDEAPPFEALLARARTDEGGRSGGRRLSRAARMGWAASVVVALGAGWIARELGLHPLSTPDGVPSTGAPDRVTDAAPAAISPAGATGSEAGSAVDLASASTSASAGRADTTVPAAAERSAPPNDEPLLAAEVEPTPPLAPDALATALEEAGVPPARTELATWLAPPRDLPSLAAPAERVQAEPPATQRLAGAVPAERAGEGTPRRGAPRQELATSSVVPLAAPTAIGLRARPDSVSAAVPELFREARPELGGRGSGAMAVVAGTDEAVDLTVPGLEVLAGGVARGGSRSPRAPGAAAAAVGGHPRDPLRALRRGGRRGGDRPARHARGRPPATRLEPGRPRARRRVAGRSRPHDGRGARDAGGAGEQREVTAGEALAFPGISQLIN